MKLVLQIALGVFFGTLTSQLTVDSWHTHQQTLAKTAADKFRSDQERIRIEQGERIRSLLLQGRKGNTPSAGFVPDDAQGEIPKEKR